MIFSQCNSSFAPPEQPAGSFAFARSIDLRYIEELPAVDDLALILARAVGLGYGDVAVGLTAQSTGIGGYEADAVDPSVVRFRLPALSH